MKEIYWGLYRKNKLNIMEAIKKDKVCLPNNISTPSSGEWFGAGSGWKLYSDEIKSKFKCKIIDFDDNAYPHAKDIIKIAIPLYLDGKIMSAELVSPVYLRDKVTS